MLKFAETPLGCLGTKRYCESNHLIKLVEPAPEHIALLSLQDDFFVGHCHLIVDSSLVLSSPK